MARRLIGAEPSSNSMLKYCCLEISEIWTDEITFSVMKICLKMSARSRPFCRDHMSENIPHTLIQCLHRELISRGNQFIIIWESTYSHQLDRSIYSASDGSRLSGHNIVNFKCNQFIIIIWESTWSHQFDRSIYSTSDGSRLSGHKSYIDHADIRRIN